MVFFLDESWCPRIESADLKLCLLSLPDLHSSMTMATATAATVWSAPNWTGIPPDVAAHIDKDNTLILLNKRDLVPNLSSSCLRSGNPVALSGLEGVNVSRIWTGSVLKNDGLDDFLSGVVEELNRR